jgi:hypothetical protein
LIFFIFDGYILKNLFFVYDVYDIDVNRLTLGPLDEFGEVFLTVVIHGEAFRFRKFPNHILEKVALESESIASRVTEKVTVYSVGIENLLYVVLESF